MRGISRYRARFSVLRPGAVWLCAGGTGGKCAGGRLAAVCVYRTGSSFLAFAALAAKHDIDNPGYAHKSFYYIGGLTEGTETIALFVLCCLFPAHFTLFAWVFGALCWLTTTTRIWSGYVTLKSLNP
jgi:hypothetical protein